MKILFVGDVFSKLGRETLARNIKKIKEEQKINFIIINGENKIGATISYLDTTRKRPLVLLIMGTGKLDGFQLCRKGRVHCPAEGEGTSHHS